MLNFYRDGLAIAMAKEDETYSQVLIAQAADTLLTMKGCCRIVCYLKA